MRTLQVISYNGVETPHIISVEDRLADLQKLVGGLIEVVVLPGELILVCTEEGKIQGLPVNHIATLLRGNYEPIAGNFFICRTNGADFASVEPGDMELAKMVVRRA